MDFLVDSHYWLGILHGLVVGFVVGGAVTTWMCIRCIKGDPGE